MGGGMDFYSGENVGNLIFYSDADRLVVLAG
jgi:hypothetical protein